MPHDIAFLHTAESHVKTFEELLGQLRPGQIDRAMADEAVPLGPRILTVATLRSTLAPTCELIEDSAKRLKTPVMGSELLVEDAWAYFEQGQSEEYWQTIADALTRYPNEVDVIVLAQPITLPGWRLFPEPPAQFVQQDSRVPQI